MNLVEETIEHLKQLIECKIELEEISSEYNRLDVQKAYTHGALSAYNSILSDLNDINFKGYQNIN